MQRYNIRKPSQQSVDLSMLTSMEQSDFESFLKMSQSRPLFVRFLLQFQSYKLKKYRWCAWDSNLEPQDGRRRRNHGAMVATPETHFCDVPHFYLSSNFLQQGEWLWLSWFNSWFQYQISVVRIQSLAKFHWTFDYCQLLVYRKDENKEKEAGNGPL